MSNISIEDVYAVSSHQLTLQRLESGCKIVWCISMDSFYFVRIKVVQC